MERDDFQVEMFSLIPHCPGICREEDTLPISKVQSMEGDDIHVEAI
jgi:hypothetical protein